MRFLCRFISTTIFGVFVSSCTPEAAPLGLVLSGGGAKGAYEIGVWKAFCDAGVDKRIKVYSGSSVGAINATLFAAVGDPSKCMSLWREAVGQVFACNKKVVATELQKTADDFDSLLRDMRKDKCQGEQLSTAEKIGAAAALTLSMALRAVEKVNSAVRGPSDSEGVCDSAKLRAVLMRSLPERWRPNPPIVYVTALAKDSGEAKAFRLNGNDQGRVIDSLMASSAIPGVFSSVKIDGVTYVDGGFERRGGDNIPLMPICDHHPEVKEVFVV